MENKTVYNKGDFNIQWMKGPLKQIIKEMEDKKYYTPDIEDIRVGYECETYATFFNVDMNIQRQEWTKLQLIPNAVKSIISKDVPIDKVRTPYLTKEQIEAEGWEDVSTDQPQFSKAPYRLYLQKDRRIWIRDMFDNDFYHGKCPSINELRYITKLLNI